MLGDWETRRGLLRIAELAGHTVGRSRMKHCRLADFMLTGEAITLAMRTMWFPADFNAQPKPYVGISFMMLG